MLLLTLARLQLGNSFSVTPQATMLVTTGLYARIRNPVYVFGLGLFVGVLLYTRLERHLYVLVPLALMQVFRARREAAVLEARFGDEYRSYKARTWF
jgi:protein-S-isoprenylcysteine O-methyltransferase Ste14